MEGGGVAVAVLGKARLEGKMLKLSFEGLEGLSRWGKVAFTPV